MIQGKKRSDIPNGATNFETKLIIPTTRKIKAKQASALSTPAKKQVRFNYDLDPSILDYNPDFGFNDELHADFSGKQQSMWAILYD